MAKQILKDCRVEINAVVLSDHCRQVTIEDAAEEVDISGFSANGYREFAQGLSDATVTLEMFQDFAAASAHATLQALKASGGTFTVKIRPTTAAISATNPEFQMTGRLFTYNMLDGGLGSESITPVVIRNASTTGPVYATA